MRMLRRVNDLLGMITRGEFPLPTSVTGPKRGAPRVGDGVLRLDAQGIVTYASPNALSCFHRLGVTGSLMHRSLHECPGYNAVDRLMMRVWAAGVLFMPAAVSQRLMLSTPASPAWARLISWSRRLNT